MKSTGSGRSRTRASAATRRSLVEIIAMLTASTIMALMVVGAGLAAQSVTEGQTSAVGHPTCEPAPLVWREST
jgi:hypothetical protein